MDPIKRPFISFIVLHYYDPAAVNKLAQDIFSSFDDAELIIVDNSGDFTLQNSYLGNHVHILRPGYNSGFARGVNLGLKKSSGQFICLVNQDVTHIKAILPLIQNLNPNEQEKKIFGVRLLSEDGSFQQSIWDDYPTFLKEWKRSTFFSLLKRNRPKSDIKDLHQKSGYVERMNGAFLLFRRSLVDDDKLFWDEDFFLYGEDVEWAWRCTHKGWKFYYNADISIIHAGSASSPNVKVKNLQVILSDFLFVAKTHSFLYTVFFLFFVYVSSRFDLFILNRNKRKGLQTEDFIWVNRRMKLYLVKKYAKLLLTLPKHENSEMFIFNCYNNDQAFAATLSAQK